MMHPALLVKRGDRLGAQPFSPAGMHFFNRHSAVDLAQQGFNKIAALVDFSDDAVRLNAVIQANGGFGLF